MTHSEEAKMNELSAAIDAINRGEAPGGKDDEIRELAAVARLLKRSGPPPAIMAGLVDTLGAELAAKRRRRRLWLTSGAAGTAAAALLVFALNTAPPPPLQPQPAIPPAGSVVIQTVPQPVPETARADDAAPPAGQPAPAREAAPAPAAREAAPAREAAVPDRPATVAQEDGASQQRRMFAKAPDKTAERVASTAADFLAWPGHDPESVTLDKKTSTVRQVYGSGDGAIIITQRPAGDAADAPVNGSSAAKADKANRVTLTVRGLVVTVEGNLPAAELQKIARSLE